ncbi:MAG TPA: Rv3654c family TadE-like protein [Marmoricola sp.]|jgi:secretion/DNA translocation related TadE-like protein|nr:Rv3654c family TadE-like protein [Marmoricola sp.]
MSRKRRRRAAREEGVAVVWALGLCAVLITVTVACAEVARMVTAHRQAQLGADLSALAGAGALRDGGAACPAADAIARRNDAHVVSCRVESHTVGVEVEVQTPGLFGVRHRMTARAVAGPGTSPVGAASTLR